MTSNIAQVCRITMKYVTSVASKRNITIIIPMVISRLIMSKYLSTSTKYSAGIERYRGRDSLRGKTTSNMEGVYINNIYALVHVTTNTVIKNLLRLLHVFNYLLFCVCVSFIFIYYILINYIQKLLITL